MRKSLFLLVLLSFVVSGNFAQEKVIERPLDVYYMEGDAPLVEPYYNVHGHKWNKKQLTDCICNASSKLTPSHQRTAIHNAFSMWNGAAGITFSEVSDPVKADVKLRWATYEHNCNYGSFDGLGGTLAHTTPYSDPNWCEIHFDDSENWSIAMLTTVAAHELGHVLGVAHSDDISALMYPTYSSSRSSITLDDLRGIWTVYSVTPTISGPSVFCDGETITYTLQNVPSSMPISWNASNKGSIVSTLGNTMKLTSRSASLPYSNIDAKLSGTTLASKVVQIGRSVVTKVNGPTTVKVGKSGTYSFEVDWYNSSTGRLVWEVLPSTGVYTSITNSQLTATFNNPGNYTLRCYIETACGVGGTGYLGVTVGYNYAVLVNKEAKTILVSEDVNNNPNNITQYIDQNSSYEIFDLLKATLVLNGNLSPMGNTTIDMNSLPQGVYLLKLRLADGTYESHKISL